MPYTAESKDLPAAVKKMSAKAREIYASTFNAVYKRNGNKDDGKAGNAFAIALRAAKNWDKKHSDKAAEDSTFTVGEPKEWAFFGPIELEALRELPEWIPLHRVGEYDDPRYGHFTMDKEKMLNAVANFYSCANRAEAPVDAQIPVDTRHSGDGACGWISAMTIHGPYLLGMPEWTPKGEEIVKNKLFRFVSPLYSEVGDDVLIKEVALTNRDFLKMPSLGHPIVLSADVDDPIILRAIEESHTEESAELESSKEPEETLPKKQQEVEMPEDKEKVLDQEEGKKELETPAAKVEDKALADKSLTDEQIKGLADRNKELEDRLLSLERERHEMLVEKHIKAAETRGIPPVIIKLVKPVMAACHESAERIITLEAEGDAEPGKANIFEAMVRLLEECPSRLGTLTTGPDGKKLEEKASTEADQTVTARLKALAEAEEEARKFAKRVGWDVIPAAEEAS